MLYLTTNNMEEAIFNLLKPKRKWLWFPIGKNNQYLATDTSVSSIDVDYQPSDHIYYLFLLIMLTFVSIW